MHQQQVSRPSTGRFANDPPEIPLWPPARPRETPALPPRDAASEQDENLDNNPPEHRRPQQTPARPHYRATREHVENLDSDPLETPPTVIEHTTQASRHAWKGAKGRHQRYHVLPSQRQINREESGPCLFQFL